MADDVVLGVLGGSGGVGASTFAAALARAAGSSTLVDLDPLGGGLDVLLGIESSPGARWSGLRVDGGRLDPALLIGGLPRWGAAAVLAADGDPPPPEAALEVIDAAAQVGVVVADLPRAPSALRDAVVRRCSLTVLVTAAEVREVAAARAVLRTLPAVAAGVVVRRGALTTADASGLLGLPVLGELPAFAGTERTGRSPGGLPRATCRVASGVVDGLLDGLASSRWAAA